MSNKFFMRKNLRKNIENDIRKRTLIEHQISRLQFELDNEIANNIKKDIEKFYNEIDDITITSAFEYIEKHGNLKQQNSMKELKARYENSNLQIEDTLNLMDWYEEMLDYYNNDIFED